MLVKVDEMVDDFLNKPTRTHLTREEVEAALDDWYPMIYPGTKIVYKNGVKCYDMTTVSDSKRKLETMFGPIDWEALRQR